MRIRVVVQGFLSPATSSSCQLDGVHIVLHELDGSDDLDETADLQICRKTHKDSPMLSTYIAPQVYTHVLSSGPVAF